MQEQSNSKGPLMANNEVFPNQHSEHGEHPHYGPAEVHEPLRERRETGGENSHETREKSASEARQEIDKLTAEHEPQKTERVGEKRVERKIDSKSARKQAYASIMSQARAEMSAPERTFSAVIHNPVVDKVSSAVADTIARPDAILSGAVFAFVLTLSIYLIAKQSGYPLTGSEAIAAFIIGWAIGNIYDYVKAMVRGGK